jgi:hypothetical protein
LRYEETDGKLDRNWLKRALGYARQAVLYGAGHHLRMLLRKLRYLSALLSSLCSPCRPESIRCLTPATPKRNVQGV